MDGGWVAKVPVVPALLMGADLVIGIDVSREIDGPVTVMSGLNIMVRANCISTEALKSLQCRLANVMIVPDVGRTHWADFSAVFDCVKQGEEATRAQIGAIRRALRFARWLALFGLSRANRLARHYRAEAARVAS